MTSSSSPPPPPTAASTATSAVANNKLTSLFSVAGKNVLITGGSRGIGLMIARGFVAAGANVLLTSRDEQACRLAAESLQCMYVASNVSHRQGCEALAHHVATVAFPNQKLDVLINNAGTSWGEPLDRISSDKLNWGWDKVMDLNVKGMFYLTRACIPLLQRTTTSGDATSTSDASTTSSSSSIATMDPGRIINIGSVAGTIPQSVPTHAYDVSKAAVHHLTRKLAGDLAPMGITVNCVAPGYVETRMSAGLAAWGADPTVLAQHIPLRRLGEEDDMAGACMYFSSKAGSWCTGVILHVDGGQIGALQIPVMSSDL